jgi:predicted membrane channel-forming protein YqfA (hemolysin III family)
LSAVSCLALSSHFHLVQCRTKEVCNKAHRGDYVSAIAAFLAESSLILLTRQIGIVVLIVGTFWPCLYFSALSSRLSVNSFQRILMPLCILPGFQGLPHLMTLYLSERNCPSKGVVHWLTGRAPSGPSGLITSLGLGEQT